MPVLELAEREARARELLPDNLVIKWIPYDDKCDASYATISAMDGYGMDCGHVLMGPTCDYALGNPTFTLYIQVYRTIDRSRSQCAKFFCISLLYILKRAKRDLYSADVVGLYYYKSLEEGLSHV